MSKKIISISLSVAIIAFLAGYGAHYYMLRNNVSGKSDVKGPGTPPVFISNVDKKNEPSKEARAEYTKLASEYLEYIRDIEPEDRISFQEFLAMRKNELIQKGRFTEGAAKIDDEISRWQNEGDEANVYTINGAVDCSNIKEKNSIIMVAVFVPSSLSGVLPEQSSAFTFTDCYKRQFDLDLESTSEITAESYTVSIVATAFSNRSFVPIASGKDKTVEGVPLSMLTKRKNNAEVKIRLYDLKDKMIGTAVTVSGRGGDILSLYGLDNIAKFIPDFNTFKTTVFGMDGTATLNSLPIGSNICFESFNPEKPDKKATLITQTLYNRSEITIPADAFVKKAPSVIIIPPRNVPEGDIVILSRSLKNKLTRHFNNFRPTTINYSDTEDAVLDLRIGNKSMGLMPLFIKKDAVTVVEPSHKRINKLCGKINIEGGACKNCSIKIKYTDKSTTSDAMGRFCLNDINIIDSSLELFIDSDEQNIIATIPVFYSHKDLIVVLSAPGAKLLRQWNNIAPTIPVNGFIYGDHAYYKSYHAFISGLDNNTNREALYIDDITGLPSKNNFSTSSDQNNAGFGKFIFPDVPQGRYILYLLTPDKIIHSRLIHAESGKITLVN